MSTIISANELNNTKIAKFTDFKLENKFKTYEILLVEHVSKAVSIRPKGSTCHKLGEYKRYGMLHPDHEQLNKAVMLLDELKRLVSVILGIEGKGEDYTYRCSLNSKIVTAHTIIGIEYRTDPSFDLMSEIKK